MKIAFVEEAKRGEPLGRPVVLASFMEMLNNAFRCEVLTKAGAQCKNLFYEHRGDRRLCKRHLVQYDKER